MLWKFSPSSDEIGHEGQDSNRAGRCHYYRTVAPLVSSIFKGFESRSIKPDTAIKKMWVMTRAEARAPGVKRKNRLSQPEDGRRSRGIQNEHNVGLRRTRALVCTQDRAEILKNSKIKLPVCVLNSQLLEILAVPLATTHIKSWVLIPVNTQNKVLVNLVIKYQLIS